MENIAPIGQEDMDFAKAMFGAGQETPVVESPITEPPVVETPPVTEAAPEAKPEPVVEKPVDYNAWLKEQVGVEDVNVLKDALNKSKEYDNILPKYTELEKRPTFQTEFGKVADDLHAKGVKPETIARFHGLNIEAMNPLEKMKLEMQVTNPNLDSQTIDDYLLQKFDVTDPSLTPGELAVRKIELEKAGANAGENLKQYVFKAFNPQPQVDHTAVQAEQNRSMYWQQNVSKVGDDAFNINLPGKLKLQGAQVQEVANDFKYQLPAEAKDLINKEFNNLIANPANASYYTADEQGIANARAAKESLVYLHYGKQMLQEAMKHAAQTESRLHEHYATILNNPNNRTVTNAQAVGVKNEAEQANAGAAGWLAQHQ